MIEVRETVIEFGAVERAVGRPECGATVSFYGVVRDHSRGIATRYLEYEAYRPMAERILGEVAAAAKKRWAVGGIEIVHRVGVLAVGEISVAVAVSAEHRAEAFAACAFVIDEIKSRVPIWKREVGDGGAEWVGGFKGSG